MVSVWPIFSFVPQRLPVSRKFNKCVLRELRVVIIACFYMILKSGWEDEWKSGGVGKELGCGLLVVRKLQTGMACGRG